MKTIQLSVLLLAAAGAAMGQQWEFGGGAGVSFLPGVPITSSVGSATTGFQTGVAFGAFAGQNLYRHLSGEIRYGFQQSNLKLESGGTKTSFSGVSHVIGYDVLLHTAQEGTRTQYFAAVGGGLKIFQGTGKEASYQPLNQFAYLTKTRELKPMLSVGAGVKYSLTPRIVLRAEFRDYITMFPKELIAAAPGAKIGSVLHDFVPMVEIGYVY